MNQNRVFSETVYQVEVGKIKNGDRTGKRNEYLILDTVNTDKHTIGKKKHQRKTVCRPWSWLKSRINTKAMIKMI